MSKKKLSKLEKELLKVEWKDIYINGELTKYQVSNTGLVKNALKNNLISSIKNNRGYLGVVLTHNGKHYGRVVHKLLAWTFIPNPENKPTVNHIDGNKLNNHMSNLEWATHSENRQHAWDTGLIQKGPRENPETSKIYSPELIHRVCKLLEEGMGDSEISKILGISKGFAQDIKCGRIWTHYSKQYNIPKPTDLKRPDNLHSKVIDLMKSGFMKNDIIIDKLGIPDTKLNRYYISTIRRRFKASGSTTIENSSH